MNYDILYYNTLTPLVLAYKGYAGAIFTAAFLLHWVRGAYSGAVGNRFRDGRQWWKTALISIMVFTIFYVPVPNPGQVIGFDSPVPIEQTEFSKTTVAIFLLERLSYGFDEMTLGLLSWDSTTGSLEGANSTDQLENFIALRGRFLKRQAKHLLEQSKSMLEIGEDVGLMDFNPLARDNVFEKLQRQLQLILHQIVSLLGVILAWILISLVAIGIFFLAGVVKYVPLFIFGAFLVLLPFGWLINGRKALGVIFQILVYLPLKTLIPVVIWLAFFVVETIQLQSYHELAAGNQVVQDFLSQVDTGWLFTKAGEEYLLTHEDQFKVNIVVNLVDTLISLVVSLLAMLYVLWKAPSLASSMLGKNGLADDMFSNMTAIATTIYTGGVALLSRLGGGEGNEVQVGRQYRDDG